MADLSAAPSGDGLGPNPLFAAKSFTESDVPLTHSDTKVANGSVQLQPAVADSTVTRPEDDSSFSTSTKYGLVLNPNGALKEITATISANVANASHVYLYRVSDGQLLDDVTGSFSPGDTVTLTPSSNLEAGSDYNLIADNDGADYTVGRYITDGFPYTSESLDLVDGADGKTGVYTSGYPTNFVSVDATGADAATAGTAIVEWDTGVPEDLYEWGVATFTQTLDGESVDVYLAYSTDDGATWQRTYGGNPVDRHYDLAADDNVTPSTPVRFEVELSRASTANNPTLNSAIWSWRL